MMKLLKKVIALIFTIVLVCAASGVSAQPLFNASVSLSSDFKSTDVTYLTYNEAFDVKLNLKTGKNYYAGPFCTQVFYTNSILKNTSTDFNKSGKLYASSKTLSGAVTSYSMTESGKNKFYPRDWDSAQKSRFDFCSITMIPNSTDCTVSPDNLDENVAVLHFSSGTNKGSGTVFVSASSLRTSDNIYGETYLSCLTDGGKVLSTRYDYGNDAVIDLSSAALSYKVTDWGDVDGNKKVNSSDALLILQHNTEINAQTGAALDRCDINRDGKVSSLDALSALQISTEITHINDIIIK